MQTYIELRGYKKLAKFKSLKDFNNNFEQIMIQVKDYFTKSEYIALNRLRKFAGSEVIGVAWPKLQKVVSATWGNAIGVSRSTFDRMLRKARKLNILTVKNEKRSDGSQTHNTYIFNKVDELTLPEPKETDSEIVSKSHTIDVPVTVKIDVAITNILLKLPRIKDKKNTYATQSVNKDLAVLQPCLKTKEQTPYEQLKTFVMNFIEDKKLASKMYGIWLAHTRNLINAPSIELAIEAIKYTINAMKTKNIKSITGYFNNTVSNLIDKYMQDELRAAQCEYIVNTDLDWIHHDRHESFAPQIEAWWIK